MRINCLSSDFFARPARDVAVDLIGVGFFVEGIGGQIVETEAYMRDDPASHSYRGATASNMAMFLGPGIAYVYRSYGLHWSFNIVCDPGSAVLVRALEPTTGISAMQSRRGNIPLRSLCAGPGNLTKALGITGGHNLLPLTQAPFRFDARIGKPHVVSGPRVGLTKAIDEPFRFGLASSPFVSRRF
ncbi:DNA-3-methyladenine glycosylase [Mesorhizobium albiziae]|uniref:Putative 3-methyladenine DNA glycosylase n=1 Tax=Neomesorhizobium albiziae TaxID=335020 RepID=A0A1I4FE28_9HYPH|nr:DNA-3-methyladenine glycosylase [Mesorhizobium albiziae]SFL15076.1 DNA-3-methyladenine glycosylase [Mesorhizobium albiziae]